MRTPLLEIVSAGRPALEAPRGAVPSLHKTSMMPSGILRISPLHFYIDQSDHDRIRKGFDARQMKVIIWFRVPSLFLQMNLNPYLS